MKSRILLIKGLATVLTIVGLVSVAINMVGCSWEDEADVASYNISKEADK